MVMSPDPIDAHVKAVNALVEQLRAMREVIPNFEIPQKGDGRRMVSVATLPPGFTERCMAAARIHAPLQRQGGLSVDQVRDLMAYSYAYRALIDEFVAMTIFLRHSVAAAKNRAGHEALTIYALARRLSKQPETAYLVPVVEAMRQALGKRIRKSKKAKAEEPKPEPGKPENE